MRVFSSAYTLPYSWAEVSTGNWLKYSPWNDKSTHVVAVDTLSRSIDPKTGILRTERLITCNQSAPAWVKTLLGGTTSHVYETSYVDPKEEKITMCSTNLTCSNIINVRETVEYTPVRTSPSHHLSSQSPPEHPAEETQFAQRAEITAVCRGWQKIKTKIEEASVERFGQNSATGREGFMHVLEMTRRVFGDERREEEERREQSV